MKQRPIIFDAESVQAILASRKSQTRRVVSFKHVLSPSQKRIGFEQCQDPNLFRCDYPSRGFPRLHVPVRHPEDPKFPWADCGCNTLEARWEPGDLLWVKETWADTNGENGPMISYQAGGDRFLVDECYPVEYSRYPGCQFTMWCGDLRRGEPDHSWRSPIHMPKWASRLTLRVTDVRVERLQEISEADAKAEGVELAEYETELPADPPGQAGIVRSFVHPFRDRWQQTTGKRAPWDSNPWVWVVEFERVEETQ